MEIWQIAVTAATYLMEIWQIAMTATTYLLLVINHIFSIMGWLFISHDHYIVFSALI